MRALLPSLARLAAAVLLTMACKTADPGPDAGSESHFLQRCTQSCAGGLECICGVCSKHCDDDAVCTALDAAASCVGNSERGASATCSANDVASCDVTCTSDGDCATLGADFVCEAGFCRQGTSASKLELSELCSVYQRDTCAAKIGCYGWDYRDVDDCLASQECDGWNQLQTLLASSAVEYDGAAALACHQRLLADPCALGEILFSVPNLAQTLKRCGALSGQLDVGAPCESSVACKSGLTCDTSSTCPSTCQLPANDDLPAGASCVPELCIPAQEHCSQCGAGLDCVNNVCAPTPKLGDACAGSLGCLSTWWCNPASSRCEKLAVVDEPCSDFRQKAAHCEEGLWCDDPSNGFETGICRALASRGGICRKDQDCNKPLTCLPPGGATPAFYGTCDDKQPNGAPCNSYADCESDLCGTSVCLPQPVAGETCTGKCAEGLICKKNEATGSGSVCAVKRYTGDPCDAASDCQNSRCIAGVCARRAALGSICQVDDDCLSKHCISGACTDPPGCTG